jgi:hypothetical protein
VILLRRGKLWLRNAALGHELPPWSLTGAAVTHPITDAAVAPFTRFVSGGHNHPLSATDMLLGIVAVKRAAVQNTSSRIHELRFDSQRFFTLDKYKLLDACVATKACSFQGTSAMPGTVHLIDGFIDSYPDEA